MDLNLGDFQVVDGVIVGPTPACKDKGPKVSKDSSFGLYPTAYTHGSTFYFSPGAQKVLRARQWRGLSLLQAEIRRQGDGVKGRLSGRRM